MKLSPSINAKLVSMGKSLQAEMETLLGPDGVLLYPPHPTVAPRHHYPICMPFNFAYTGEQLCTGLSVPSDRPSGGGGGLCYKGMWRWAFISLSRGMQCALAAAPCLGARLGAPCVLLLHLELLHISTVL